jgi:hypothetical protein
MFGCFVDNHHDTVSIARVYLDFDRVGVNSTNRRRANLREHVLVMFGTERKGNQVLDVTTPRYSADTAERQEVVG